MPDESPVWELMVTDIADAEREALFLSIGRQRGPEYARRWLDSLVDATNAILMFPGPRSCPTNSYESERRRAEVRTRLYRGPDSQNPAAVACKIVFSVYDPTQQQETGQVRILRYLKAQGQDVQVLNEAIGP
jgi:plasmid stabilization system protein ParE